MSAVQFLAEFEAAFEYDQGNHFFKTSNDIYHAIDSLAVNYPIFQPYLQQNNLLGNAGRKGQPNEATKDKIRLAFIFKKLYPFYRAICVANPENNDVYANVIADCYKD